MKKTLFILIAIITLQPKSFAEDIGEEKIGAIMNAIQSMYIDSVSEEELVDAAIVGMISHLDPHSTYLNEKMAEKAKHELEGRYFGYGFEARFVNDTLTIMRTICDGPADNAGLRPGDKVINIAGQSTIIGTYIDSRLIDELLKNNKGFKINFTIIREGSPTPETIKIKSGKVEQSTVYAAYIPTDKIGIISIKIIGETTGNEFKQAIKKLTRQGAKRLIIDLRGNKGGYVGSVNEMASCIFNEEIVAVNMISGKGEETHYNTTYDPDNFQGEIIVIVDSNTASSAELFAAVIQDYDRGIIIGRPTFGKALSQRTIHISDGSELLLSTSKCFSPSGRCIQREYHISHETYRKLAQLRLYDSHKGLPNANNPAFTTLKTGRTVYGECGITPDMIIDRDTLGQELIYDQFDEKNVFDITAAKTFKLTHGDPNIISDYGIAERLCRTAKTMNINCNATHILESPLIMARAKAEIIRLKDCKTNIIIQTYRYDRDILRAISILFDTEEYNKILNKTK